MLTCTHKAYKAVKKKYRTFARYKDKNHPAYVTASRKAKKLIKAARRNFETKLAAKIKDDKKSFFAYLRSRTKSRISPGPLSSNDNTTPLSDKDMADKFNDYFSSVFTEESVQDIPVCDTPFPYPGEELSDVCI